MLESLSKTLVKIRVPIFILFVSSLFIDAFIQKNYDLELAFSILTWLLVVRAFNLKSSVTFKVSLIFLGILLVLFVIARTHPLVERISTWIYLFLAVGVIQQFREITAK